MHSESHAWKKIGKILTLLIGVAAIALLVSTSQPKQAHADAASDLQAQIDAQNKAISDLEAEIAGYQSQLSTLGASKNTPYRRSPLNQKR